MKARLKLLVMAGLASACLAPTEVKIVVLSHELTCAGSGDLAFDSLAIAVSPTTSGLVSEDPSATSQFCASRANETDLGSLVLVPRTTEHAEVVVAAGISVTAANGTVTKETGEECLAAYHAFLQGTDPNASCGGGSCVPCVVATRGIGFVDHQRLSLDIELTAKCQGVFCQAGQTCGNDGACISNEVRCHGGNCDFSTGGAGGTGGGGSTASASSSTVSTGSGGAGAFVPVLGTTSGVPIGPVSDLWTDGTSDVVWAVGDAGLFECQGTCASRGTLVPPAKRISGAGKLIAQSNGQSVQTIDTSTALVKTTPTAGACVITDLFALNQTVYLGVTTTQGASAISDSTSPCVGTALSNANPVDAIWAFSAAQDRRWATGGPWLEVLGVATSGPWLLGNSSVRAAGMWGQAGSSGDFVVSCLVSAAPTLLFARQEGPRTYAIPKACNAIWGLMRPTGGADIWMGVNTGAVGVSIIDGLSPTIGSFDTSLDSGIPSGEQVTSVAVTPSQVWVGTTLGLWAAPRPTLP